VEFGTKAELVEGDDEVIVDQTSSPGIPPTYPNSHPQSIA